MKHIIRFLLFPIMLFCQNNNSYTFSEPIIVNSNPDLGLSRPQIITQNNGDPLIMWTSIDDKKIYVSRYLNGEFSEPILISPPDLTFYGNQNYGPEIDSNDDYIAIVLHNSIDNLNNDIIFLNPATEFQKRDIFKGGYISVAINKHQTVSGINQGIDEEGRLLIQESSKSELTKITTGSIQWR